MVVKTAKKDSSVESTNPYEKPVSQSAVNFIYNSETGAFMGRTASSWGKIGLFYLIFYGVLAALVYICYWGFSQTLNPRIPKWQLDQSLIGTNPGLGFRPMPSEENVESTLIWFKGSDPDNYNHWVTSLKRFLEEYKKPGQTAGSGEHVTTQGCDNNLAPIPGKVCPVRIDGFHPCTAENHFGYHKSTPCIFLKLNKIYNWVPEFYNSTKGLPENMPKKLKEHILDVELHSRNDLNTIWVSCEGENPADKENIGPVKYIPRWGFPGYYYPYLRSEGYRSPLVAVYFERPSTGMLINIECKAWARNIKHNRNDKIGSVHFELLID